MLCSRLQQHAFWAFINVLVVLSGVPACAQTAEQVRHVVQSYAAADDFSGDVVIP